MAKETKQKKKKGRSIQQLIGIKTFTKSGIKVGKDELFFFAVAPTNISVLSAANIEGKIRQMMGMISAVPEIEISCTDSSECFDDNKLYLKSRLEKEPNPNIRKLMIKQDMDFLDSVQTDISTARQFMEQGFDFRHLKKPDIKRMLAIYFDASMYGEQMPDVDGAQFLEVKKNDED